MYLLSTLIFISLLLVVVLKLASVLISEKVVLNREELSPYECGFEHHNVSRIPFSLRYFFLTLIFLLFDLEIVLMLFIPYSLFTSSFLVSFSILFLFLLILFFRLIYEWNDGTLDWISWLSSLSKTYSCKL
jgi:NADH-ubiquinone oxidoreductase chain 3